MIAAPEKQNFKLEDFEGPLDLLLFLVRKNEVNIYDIPIAAITEQYLEFLKLATSIDLDAITEFYQLAATLLYIKSRTLLPAQAGDEDESEDPRQELVEKLIEYQKYKRLAELMAEQETESEWIWERKKKLPVLPFEDQDDFWETVEVWDLLQTFSKIMKGLSPQRIIDLYEEVSVNEKVALVYELLETRGSFLFTDLVTRPESLLDVVCAFLALLEMVKGRHIVLAQSRLFGDIRISARPEGDQNPEASHG
ncbi:MAG TPA: segregation/condensation protein A [Spirochaetia bacterium]|nr:segregation/condensation protein A [Spirochaetia bacterium]